MKRFNLVEADSELKSTILRLLTQHLIGSNIYMCLRTSEHM